MLHFVTNKVKTLTGKNAGNLATDPLSALYRFRLDPDPQNRSDFQVFPSFKGTVSRDRLGFLTT